MEVAPGCKPGGLTPWHGAVSGAQHSTEGLWFAAWLIQAKVQFSSVGA